MSEQPRRRRYMTSSRQRFLAEAVVAATGQLVGMAMDGAWQELSRALRDRRERAFSCLPESRAIP